MNAEKSISGTKPPFLSILGIIADQTPGRTK